MLHPTFLGASIAGTEVGHKSERAAQFVTASTCPARSPSHLAQDLLGLCPKRKEVDQYTFIESRGGGWGKVNEDRREGEGNEGRREGEEERSEERIVSRFTSPHR
jgi:hypothetical protein